MRSLPPLALALAIFAAIGASSTYAADGATPASPSNHANSPAAKSGKSITKRQAENLVWKLPEVKAWVAYVKRISKGKSNGATHDWETTAQRADNGHSYWSVDVAEDDAEHMVTWTTFLVRTDGKEILVDDIVSGERWTLEQWRDRTKPMEQFTQG